MSRFTVWVDGDSCPSRIRDIVERAALRRGVHTVFVADRRLPVQKAEQIEMIVVDAKEGSSDDRIVSDLVSGDIVVTRDVGLSVRAVERGAVALDDRGNRFSDDNIGERRSIHGYMSELRSRGIETRGAVRSPKDPVGAFANAFDRELTPRLARKSPNPHSDRSG